MGYWGVKNLGYGILGVKNLGYGILGGKKSGIWDMGTPVSPPPTGYLLMTTYPSWLNTDLLYGMKYRFRAQNLELPPYSLTRPQCQDRDGETDVMALWHLPLKQIKDCRKPQVDVYESDAFDQRVYTCL